MKSWPEIREAIWPWHSFADWWRGYTDLDLASYRQKAEGAKPGSIYWVSKRELRASNDYYRKLYARWPS